MKIKVNISGTLFWNRKILLIQRSLNDDFLPGFFELPGGGLEVLESPSEGLIREFIEETNLHIKVEEVFYVFDYYTDNNTFHNVEIIYFVLNHKGGVPKIDLSIEHTTFIWAEEKDINEYNITPEIKNVIYLAFKKYIN